MAKALRIVDKNDASRLQPIDGRSRISLTQFRRPRRQLPEERVTRFKLCKVPHSFVRRHDPAGRTSDLHAPNGRKIRIIGRHRGRNTRICFDFPGMLRIGIRYPDECQSVACVEQTCCVRSARTECSERHHMVRCEKRANPLAEVYIHNRPSHDRGANRLRKPRQNDSVSIDPRSSRNYRLNTQALIVGAGPVGLPLVEIVGQQHFGASTSAKADVSPLTRFLAKIVARLPKSSRPDRLAHLFALSNGCFVARSHIPAADVLCVRAHCANSVQYGVERFARDHQLRVATVIANGLFYAVLQ